MASGGPKPAAAPGTRRVTVALGIDVGGTKIAAGIVDRRERARSLERRGVPTRPERGGAAVLATAPRSPPSSATDGCRSGSGCASSSTSTAGRRARTRSTGAASTWRRRSARRGSSLESDVRAAALAEARFGAGPGARRSSSSIVGTGASACLVVDGDPYAGAHGEAIVLGAPPVERGRERPGARPRGGARARRGRPRGSGARARSSTPRRLRWAACSPCSRTRSTRRSIVLGGGLGAQRGFRRAASSVACRRSLAYPRRAAARARRLRARPGRRRGRRCAAWRAAARD